MQLEFDGDPDRWRADYEKQLPWCAKRLCRMALIDPFISYGPAPRRDEIVRAIAKASLREWRPELVKLEASARDSIPRSEARRLAAFRRAISESITWDELLEKIDDPVTHEHVMEEFEDQEPEPGVWIDLQDVSEDFITDPKRAMLRWLPDSVRRLGRVIDEEGPWLHLEDSAFGQVVEALAAEGYEACKDPGDDVRTAFGEGSTR